MAFRSGAFAHSVSSIHTQGLGNEDEGMFQARDFTLYTRAPARRGLQAWCSRASSLLATNRHPRSPDPTSHLHFNCDAQSQTVTRTTGSLKRLPYGSQNILAASSERWSARSDSFAPSSLHADTHCWRKTESSATLPLRTHWREHMVRFSHALLVSSPAYCGLPLDLTSSV